MKLGSRIEQLKVRPLLSAITLIISVTSFAVGYRIPNSRPGNAGEVEVKQSSAPRLGPDHVPMVDTHGVITRDGLKVEGFAKIGFPEIEEVLMTASLEQREQWARELGALPDQPLKSIAYVAFYTAWLDLEPEQAIRSLREFPDLMNRRRVFASLAPAVPPAVLPEFVEVISQLSEVERRDLLPVTLLTLGETDPEAAARFIDSHPKLVSNSEAAELLSTWAKDNVDSARKWLEASPFFDQPEVVWSLVDSWFVHNPDAARDYVLLHREDDGFISAASLVASHLFNSSPEQARAFITVFDDDRASLLMTHLAGSVSEDQLGKLVIWVSTLPSSIGKDGLGYALTAWSRRDPKEALDWLRTKPAAERESLVIQMFDSEAALVVSREIVSLAYGIRDSQKREEALTNLVRSLHAQTGDATEQIRAFGLSDSQTNHLLELLPVPAE